MYTCPACGSHEIGNIPNDTEVCSRCYSHFKKSNHDLFEEWLVAFLNKKTKKPYVRSETTKLLNKIRNKERRVTKRIQYLEDWNSPEGMLRQEEALNASENLLKLKEFR